MRLRRIVISIVLWFCISMALYACSDESMRDLPPLTSTAKIDLKRYMGAWYVIAGEPTDAFLEVGGRAAEGESEAVGVARRR